MPRFDLPLDELRRFRPPVLEPVDFDRFWADTLAESRAMASAPLIERVPSQLTTVEVYDVTFSGFAGDQIRAWYLRPAGVEGDLPAVIEYNGYGGGRGLPHERMAWAAAGYAYFFMDTRGQGSVWGTGGSTPDPHGSGAAAPGFMTRGIEDPSSYYYRRVFTDAVLLVDAARSLDGVDETRIAVTGASQGGGIALAVGGLVGGLVGVMPDVPFLCHFERAVGMTAVFPYQEVAQYLAVHRDDIEQAFRTLSYFDGVNFAKRATAPALFSAGGMDQVCPPSTVFAAANHWAADAEVVFYEFNEHEGGQGMQWERQSAWLSRRQRAV
ncbi:acetylxylan esterase [Lacisediminihabitans changchengi]|uniref:Acetylxylan esterase n=1 Tax=Lacisediminihabitans changchengi TaxID=2787634 RepID=A0A934SNV3_9MICO|nr:acetylxylan esterase [Lacisediminihabitans changchengi]MBK4348462.1 acetylxylan esterase [Lacisediminihabitans changchengi]